MRLYMKGNYSKKIPYTLREFVEKMYFVSTKDRQLEFGYFGSDMPLQEDLFLSITFYKRRESEWFDIWKELDLGFASLEDERIELQFENEEATNYQEKGECLRIRTTHLNLLTVDKRAVYTAAIEVATAIEGQISEDDKATWFTPEEFKIRHQDVLSLTYEQATEKSLKEIRQMEAIDDPTWEEDKQKAKAYIVDYYTNHYQWPKHIKDRFIWALDKLEEKEEPLWFEDLKPIAQKIYEEWVDETSFGF